MTALNPYVERDNNASGANVVFAGKRYWLVGYCEGDGIWSDDAQGQATWANDSAASGSWVNDSGASGTWTDAQKNDTLGLRKGFYYVYDNKFRFN